MPQTRNPMTLLIIGTAIGAVLGVVIGIAIGQASASAGARVTSVRTVVSTRTIRVPGLGGTSTPVSSQTTTATTPTTSTFDTTTTTDTTPAFTTPTDTTPSFTTPTDTTTTAGGVAPNDVPPADPYNPPRNFCTTHVCEPGFSKGFGLVVQCADGVWSMQGGQTGVCRNDGGVP
jgi:hypothetical protein